MGKILKDSTARDLITTIQAVKDMAPAAFSSKPRSGAMYIMLKLTTEIAGNNDLWNSKEVQYNTNTNVWDDVTGGRGTDSDLPVLVEGGGIADDIIRAFPSRDTDGDSIYIAARGGGGSISTVKITVVTNDSTYTGRIIDNDTDQGETTGTNITVKALRHSDGEFPVNTILDCYYDAVNDVYCPVGYNYFYG